MLWIFRRDCVLARALASPHLASHEFCNKSRVGGAHLFSLPSAAPQHIPSPALPFQTFPFPAPPPPGFNPLSTLVEFPFRIVPRHFSRQMRSLVREIPRRSISVFLPSLFFFVSTSFLSTSTRPFPPPCLSSVLFLPVRNGAQR